MMRYSMANEPQPTFPSYDLEGLISLARQWLRARELPITSLDVYNLVGKLRGDQLRSLRHQQQTPTETETRHDGPAEAEASIP